MSDIQQESSGVQEKQSSKCQEGRRKLNMLARRGEFFNTFMLKPSLEASSVNSVTLTGVGGKYLHSLLSPFETTRWDEEAQTIYNFIKECDASKAIRIGNFLLLRPTVLGNKYNRADMIERSITGLYNSVEVLQIVNYIDGFGFTPLMRAICLNDADSVTTLLALGAKATYFNHITPLMLAAKRGHASIIALLLPHVDDVDTHDLDGMTALMYACYKGHYRCVISLLEAGAKASAVTAAGQSPLMFAAHQGSISIFQALFEYGASLSEYDSNSKSTLCYCMDGESFYGYEGFRHGKLKSIQLAKQANVGLNRSRGDILSFLISSTHWFNFPSHSVQEVLVCAIKHQAYFGLLQLLNDGFRLQLNSESLVTIHRASLISPGRGQVNTAVRLLALRGFLRDSKALNSFQEYMPMRGTRSKCTMLMAAIWSEYVKTPSPACGDVMYNTARLLIQNGADVNLGELRPHHVISPLTSSFSHPTADALVPFLLHHGADPNLCGQCPGLGIDPRIPVHPLLLAALAQKRRLVEMVWIAGGRVVADHALLLSNRVRHSVLRCLVDLLSRPRTLRDLCRIKTRALLGSDIRAKVDRLSTLLPRLVQSYLLYNNWFDARYRRAKRVQAP